MSGLSNYHFRELVTSEPEESALEAAGKMENKNVGCILVTSGTEIVGIATRYDFVHNLIVKGKDPRTTKIKQIMHASPVTIEGKSTITDALKKMIAKKVDRLVVRSGKDILGVISLEDIVAEMESDSFKEISRQKYDEIFDMVRRLTPNLLSRYDGDEKKELQNDMSDEVGALLRLLEEAEISLRP